MSYLFHNAVVLLTHRRLRELSKALERKRRLGNVSPLGPPAARVPVVLNNVEHRVFALADAASKMFEGGGAIRVPTAAVLGQGTGKYAIMGSIALELPGMVGYLAPNQGWFTDLIRRGSPDPNFSRVVTGSTQLAIRAGEIAISRVGDNEGKKRLIEAFVMGMLCSIAADIVAGPVLRGAQFAVTRRDWDRFMPRSVIAAAETRIAVDLLGSPTQEHWHSWWPSDTEVPGELYDGYLDALREVYGTVATRPRGFADFETDLSDPSRRFEPGPELTSRDLMNAYSLFRHGDVTLGRGWQWYDWWAFLQSILVPPFLGMLVASVLPRARDLFRPATASGARPPDSRGWMEVLIAGYYSGIVTPFVLALVLHAHVPGDTDAFWESVGFFISRLIFAIPAFLLIGDQNSDPTSRWVTAGLIGAIDVYALVRSIVAFALGQRGPGWMFLIQVIPLFSAGVVALMALFFDEFNWNAGEHGEFWGFWVLWLVLFAGGLGLFIGWLFSLTGGISVMLRQRRDGQPLLDRLPTGGDDVGRALAHVFDDSTLWADSRDGGAPLVNHRYAAGRRALLRLIWTGDGALEVNVKEHTITFLKADGTRVIVTLPGSPLTVAGLAVLLEARLPGLSARVLDALPQYALAYPNTFSDAGDDKDTTALHDVHVDDFVPVGRDEDTAYYLRHVPRGKLTTTFGVRGASSSPIDGFRLVPSATLADVDTSALGIASDLASLLCMGAARSLRGASLTAPPIPAPGNQLAPVFQVFRQWNLDERRANEWRMLVHGGAASEKNGAAGGPDPAMRPSPAGYASPAAAGEPLCNSMGWVPLFRAWSRMAVDPLANTTAPLTRMPYTPPVQAGPGAPVPPTNQQLSDAIRFLLDLVA